MPVFLSPRAVSVLAPIAMGAAAAALAATLTGATASHPAAPRYLCWQAGVLVHATGPAAGLLTAPAFRGGFPRCPSGQYVTTEGK